MTYPRHLRLQFGGPLFTAEQWSCSLALVQNFEGSGVPDAPTVVPEATITAVQGFLTNNPYVGNVAKLSFIKLNEIGPDGRYLDRTGSVMHEFTGTLPTGGSSGQCLPPQCAATLSWTTGARRGLASRGRVFLPGIVASAVGTDGLFTSAAALGMANAAVSFINAVDYSLAGWEAGVVSGVREGNAEVIRGVRVGRVVDTQRRRRSNLPESYVTATTARVVLDPAP